MSPRISGPQKEMLKRIAMYRWRDLKPLGISDANPTLKSLVRRGLVQVRTESAVYGLFTEVRRVAMQDVRGQLNDATMVLINALPSKTREVLKKEVAAVLQCIVQEESK